MRKPSVESLAPATPEHVVSSQSSTLEPTDTDEVVVLESSPARPGTSKAVRVGPGSVQRLSSFFFRGAPPPPPPLPLHIATADQLASEDEAEAAPGGGEGQRTPVSEAAGDLQQMGISPPRKLHGSDFGDIVRQFRWRDDDDDGSAGSDSAASRKRARETLSPDRRKRPAADPPRARPRGRLLRGARPEPRAGPPSRASTSASPEPSAPAAAAAAAEVIEVEDYGSDSKAGAAEEPSSREFEDIDPHIMQLFNHGSSAELMEKTGATAAEAEAVAGLRPFGSADEIEATMRKTRGVRLALYNQYRDTLLGHMEVESVLGQCAGMCAQLQGALDAAGIRQTETGITAAADTMVQPRMVNERFQLKHYQLEGVEWLTCLRNAGGSGILADEMGLGKTFQVIAFLCRGLEDGRGARGPSLVVCPSSTLDNWMNECAKFAPSLRAVAYCGSQPERLALQAELQDEAAYDVLITTYTLATGNKMDRVFLKKRRFAAMILDEGHMVKNCMSSRYKWLVQIPAPFRLLLTGTPLQNNLQELVSLLAFILPQVVAESQLALSHAFKTKQRRGTAADPEDTPASASGVQTPVAVGPVDAHHIEQAKKLLRPFVLRRCKCDVLGDLPAKTEHVVRVELTAAQRTLYDSVAPDAEDIRGRLGELDSARLDEPPQAAGGRRAQASWIATFMDMRKAADHPLLLRSQYDRATVQKMARQLLREPDYADSNYQYVVEDMEVCSDFELHQLCGKYPRMGAFALPDARLLDAGKVRELKTIVDACVAGGEKLLVFSQFTSMLNVLEAVLGVWGVAFFRLDGQTKVDERQGIIDEFNAPACAVPVFLLSTKAGGFGINLTAANVVVIYDAGNNPSEERQAEDRAHRVGQTKDVRVYRLIAANTIDEDILESSRSKLLVEQMFWF
ncbi:DNA-dependent ATPase fun30 [Coemansia helicoidea]|uniref:DNA-dependent ATPase fun30 n=1 Tax=Coemansia helicoidea TaxID=1286919 RepID=A0ACC1LH26_9FUNG|nr:DNA-dependent ATPase fun30 [Coemansia helicoidea]